MIVSTCGTGEYERKEPEPSGNGTQAGSRASYPVTRSRHLVTLALSQPHPGPPGWTMGSPAKPSTVAATTSRWLGNDGTGNNSNVRSDSA